MSFPADFVWGAASASYQIEGGWQDDGKGLSVWDVFSHQPGKITNGDTGDVACDHYHRYAEDVALMQALGLGAYRFSIAWPRVIPAGVGAVNPAGLDFYDRLVDVLLAAKIKPYATLFHWDFPYALHRRGGWKTREVVEWFENYTRVVVERLGDRVACWMPLNEPAVFLNMGYREGFHAPGLKVSNQDFLYMMHHMFLAHGTAVQTIRATAKNDPLVGTANVAGNLYPVSDDPADVAAARTAMFNASHLWNHGWWSDPMLLGKYPEDRSVFDNVEIPVEAGDMAIIQQPLDILGVNVYNGYAFRAGADGLPEPAPHPVGGPRTYTDWAVTPTVLYWTPQFLHERYKLPILITENGLSLPDWVALDGQVYDPGRIDFLQRYLREYRRAAEAGVPLHGYMQWSLTDNFEWAHGMKHRFGLIYVDYQTQKRTPKDSAYWYRDVIASNGANL